MLALAAHIRRTVKAWTGIPVSVGIGPTKTLAKAASRVAKQRPDAQGVWSLITPSSQHDALSQLPVGDVWGIGRQWAKLLEAEGITTALAFSQQSDTWLKKHLNVVGLRTAWELRGIPCIPIELAPPPRKGLMVSRSFGRRITEFEPLREALAAYVTRAGEKLRRERRHARQMMIFVHNSPFDTREAYYSRQASFQLPHPTSDTAELIHHACHALARLYRPGVRYSKCGVMLTELTPDTVHQGDFLDTRDTARSKQLMATVRRHQPPHGPRQRLLCRLRRQTRLGDGRHDEKPALHDGLAAVDADQNLTRDPLRHGLSLMMLGTRVQARPVRWEQL